MRSRQSVCPQIFFATQPITFRSLTKQFITILYNVLHFYRISFRYWVKRMNENIEMPEAMAERFIFRITMSRLKMLKELMLSESVPRIVKEHLDRNWEKLYASQVEAENFENWK